MSAYQSIKLGNLSLDSRIVMPPIATYSSTEMDGNVTEKMLEYYEKRAANKNVGMIITEHSYILPQGKAKSKQLSISDDSNIEGLKRLTEVIHKNGTKVIAQLNHAGSAAIPDDALMDTVAPSPIIFPAQPPMGNGSVPKELSEAEIRRIIDAFVKAAVRAKKAGYDGVEIHSAHGYLLNQFYSPLTNFRKDEYGGDMENRLRIHREVIRAVREETGREFFMSVRLGGCDYMDGGNGISECVRASRILEKEGIDLLSLTGGLCRYTRAGHTESGYFQDMSLAVKKETSLPVLLTGGVKTMAEAEELLEKGVADLIGVGRALMKDYNWECD